MFYYIQTLKMKFDYNYLYIYYYYYYYIYLYHTQLFFYIKSYFKL